VLAVCHPAVFTLPPLLLLLQLLVLAWSVCVVSIIVDRLTSTLFDSWLDERL